jgi:CRISPR/Cas system CSM-associated protein Csm3 (group 7 of RAMP superfamily)
MPDHSKWDDKQRPEPEPKPFGKVSLTRGKSLRRVTGHDRFSNEYTGSLLCTMTALAPIHIGSGIYNMERESIVRGLITAESKVVIPGTSLKGAIRSITEAISDSCIRVTRREIVNNLAVKDAKPCDELRPSNIRPVCVSCSIFGTLGYQGRVSFTDARLLRGRTDVQTIRSPYPPRDSARGYKNAFREFNGRKFYYHGEPVSAVGGEPYQVIVPNSEFEFLMDFESLTAEELCLILVALGILDDIIIKVGGCKQAMLGSVELIPERLELRNPAASFKSLSESSDIIEGDNIKPFLDRIGKAGKLVNESALDELIKIWEYPTNRKAPTGMY